MIIKTLFLLVALCQTGLLFCENMASMSAVQLNTSGFKLYQAKKFEEASVYFKAAFAKDPNHSLAHYNYACVLSILKKDKDEIFEHLMYSFFLNPDLRKDYFSDADLAWFRKNPAPDTPFPENFTFDLNNYSLDVSEKKVRECLFVDFDVYILVKPYHIGYFTFENGNKLRMWNGESDVQAQYQIKGNMIYIEFDKDFVLKEYSISIKKIMLLFGKSLEKAGGDIECLGWCSGFILDNMTLQPVTIQRVFVEDGV
jgi:tetratricopeptide (TPR) repeat protein